MCIEGRYPCWQGTELRELISITYRLSGRCKGCKGSFAWTSTPQQTVTTVVVTSDVESTHLHSDASPYCLLLYRVLLRFCVCAAEPRTPLVQACAFPHATRIAEDACAQPLPSPTPPAALSLACTSLTSTPKVCHKIARPCKNSSLSRPWSNPRVWCADDPNL